jgi:hypothetical protein
VYLELSCCIGNILVVIVIVCELLGGGGGGLRLLYTIHCAQQICLIIIIIIVSVNDAIISLLGFHIHSPNSDANWVCSVNKQAILIVIIIRWRRQ